MRGVNKLVLEVKSDGEYFEKALLFLKPEKQNAPQKEISDGAEKLLKKIQAGKTRKNFNIPAAIICTAAGAGASLLIMAISGVL